MKITTPVTLFTSILAVSIAAQAGNPPGWHDLLAGDSLRAWVDGDGKPVKAGKWTVKEGVLHLSGKGGGNIYTARDYGDFELTFEWKIAPRGNSGVKYRMAAYPDKGRLGPEYQVYDDGGKLFQKGSTAGLYDIVAPDPETKELKPVGEWNSSRIVTHGGHLQHFLNGKKVVDIMIGTPKWKTAVARSKFRSVPGFAENARGPIMLQDHGSEVWYRRILIRER